MSEWHSGQRRGRIVAAESTTEASELLLFLPPRRRFSPRSFRCRRCCYRCHDCPLPCLFSLSPPTIAAGRWGAFIQMHSFMRRARSLQHADVALSARRPPILHPSMAVIQRSQRRSNSGDFLWAPFPFDRPAATNQPTNPPPTDPSIHPHPTSLLLLSACLSVCLPASRLDPRHSRRGGRVLSVGENFVNCFNK